MHRGLEPKSSGSGKPSAFSLDHSCIFGLQAEVMADDILIEGGGDYANAVVRSVLENYLPSDVLSAFDGRLAFVSTTAVDGVRLTKSFCRDRDVIVLSERIIPVTSDEEFHPAYRYFIFVILREVAHACKDHVSPFSNNLTAPQVESQTREAEELALKWFNEHASTTLFQPHLTVNEIEELRARPERTAKMSEE